MRGEGLGAGRYLKGLRQATGGVRQMSAPEPDRALMALVAGFVLLVLACIGAFWLAGEQQRSAAWVNHSLEVENRISNVLSLLQDAETGQRGYLLTGRLEFLEPYRIAAPRL